MGQHIARRLMLLVPAWLIMGIIAFPSLALSVTILGLNLFGDGLRDVLDPRLRV